MKKKKQSSYNQNFLSHQDVQTLLQTLKSNRYYQILERLHFIPIKQNKQWQYF